MKIKLRSTLVLNFLLLSILFIPASVFAERQSVCLKNGYSIVTINGIFTNEESAIKNRDKLRDYLPKTYNGEKIKVDFLHNPSHLAGLGDAVKVVYQKVFENETVQDYDLVEMIKTASEKVDTQKLLLVAHSQGNFYANSFYDSIANKDGGVPAESISVYGVATPASRVAGGGNWVTSDTDKIISGFVASVPFKSIMKPNTHIELAEGDDEFGHNFAGVYLKHRAGKIVSDIENSLGKLKNNEIQLENSACISPPELTKAHKIEGAILAVVDPVAEKGVEGVGAATSGLYKTGVYLAKATKNIVFSVGSLTFSTIKTTSQGAAAFLSQEDDVSVDSENYGENGNIEENNVSNSQSEDASLFNNNSQTYLDREIPEIIKNDDPVEPPIVAALNTDNNNPKTIEKPKSYQNYFSPGFGGGVAPVLETALVSVSVSTTTENNASSTNQNNNNSNNDGDEPPVPPSPAPLEPEQDTTPPSVSINSANCTSSISQASCVILGSSENIILEWSSSATDLSYFIFNNNGSISTTTATSTELTLSAGLYSYSIKAVDTTGNISTEETKTIEISDMPVVINEVAWGGTNASGYDEWIELYNNTDSNINLNGWILQSLDESPYIELSGNINAHSYYLIERKESSETNETTESPVKNIPADLWVSFNHGLSNSGENLFLYRVTEQATSTIDQIPYCFNWCGKGFGAYSMERVNSEVSGSNWSNWTTNTGLIKNGTDVQSGLIYGTPKARNSASYLLNNNYDVESNLTLTKANSPYVVEDRMLQVAQGATLTIEPGVVIKFYDDAGLKILGNIIANGTADDPIVLTSFSDDNYGGDTNGDATSTSPASGNWFGVELYNDNLNSAFSNILIRYGGKFYSGMAYKASNLYIENSSPSITNLTSEYSKRYGLYLNGSSSVVSSSSFSNNNFDATSIGVNIVGGIPVFASNNFAGNTSGLYLSSSPASISANIFSNNTASAISSFGTIGDINNNSGVGNGINAIVLGGDLTQANSSSVLKQNNLPFYMWGPNPATIVASSTLTIDPGVIIKGSKISYNSVVNVFGNMIVNGNDGNSVIFTSVYDDNYGGDTLNDSTTTSPSLSDWGGIFAKDGSSIVMNHSSIKYSNTALTFENSPINLSNVTFSNNTLALAANTDTLGLPIAVTNVIFDLNVGTTSPDNIW